MNQKPGESEPNQGRFCVSKVTAWHKASVLRGHSKAEAITGPLWKCQRSTSNPKRRCDADTCDDVLVSHEALQVARPQAVEGGVGGGEQRVVARLVQLVHGARGQRCHLLAQSSSHVGIRRASRLLWWRERERSYTKGGQLVFHIQEAFDGAADGADDAVDDVHHAVGGHLVGVDDPGAVDRHHLRTRVLSFVAGAARAFSASG